MDTHEETTLHLDRYSPIPYSGYRTFYGRAKDGKLYSTGLVHKDAEGERLKVAIDRGERPEYRKPRNALVYEREGGMFDWS